MKKLAVLLFLGALVRLVFVFQPGFAADIAYWKSWSLATVDKGVVWTTMETNYNYAPAFLYFLKIVGWVYKLGENPVNFGHYWQANNQLFLAIIKLPVIASDLFTIWGIWWICGKVKTENAKRKTGNPLLRPFGFFDAAQDKFAQGFGGQAKLKIGGREIDVALLAAGYYAFNPFIIFEGSYWGQVGSIGSASLVAAFILIFKKKPLWAVGVATLGFLLKLQMMFFVPLTLVWVGVSYGWKKLAAAISVMVGVFLAVSLPFLVSHHMEKIVFLILKSADWFPYLSLNAYNLWWIVARGAGFGTLDRIWVWGPMTAKALGLFLFLVIYTLAVLLSLKKRSWVGLFKAGLWVSLAFFMLPTQMHERYLYPAFLFAALLSPHIVQLAQEKKWEAWVYGGLWLILPWSGFYNLHNVMWINYPEYSFRFLSGLNQLGLTLAVSWLHLGVFIALSLVLMRELGWKLAGGILTLAGGGLLVKQMAFAATSEIPLSSVSPVVSEQDYGVPMKNLTVNAGWGWRQANFLSSNYYFYRNGWGSHANSNLVFPVRGGFGRFSSDVGIDSEAGEKASVNFQIYGDSRLLWESGMMGRFDLPRHADVDIGGVSELKLVVKDGGDGIYNDHADWLNPILYR